MAGEVIDASDEATTLVWLSMQQSLFLNTLSSLEKTGAYCKKEASLAKANKSKNL